MQHDQLGTWVRRFAGVFASLFAACLCGCHSTAHHPSEGAARANPAADLHGTVICCDEDEAIIAYDTPSGRRRTVRPAPRLSGDFQPGIWSVAGPDAEGRVAFVEAYFPKPSHALKIIRLDGSVEQTIFQHPGDPIWKRAIGRHMALARAGGRLALVGQMHGAQMPSALLDEGPLEVWNIDKRTNDTFGQVIDDGVAWLPDSLHVACVRLLPRDRLPQVKEPEDGFGKLWARWDRVPAICIIDVGTGQERVICQGVEPVVSTDGTQLLVADYPSGDGRLWRRVQISTGSGAAVAYSLNRTYLAFDDSGKGLYLAQPLAGEPSDKTKYFSPLRGPSEMLALRFGPLDGPASAAVRIADGFDPRNFASFGHVAHSHDSHSATDR